MINLTEIYTNKYRNRPATNSAQAQPEKGMRLCAETLYAILGRPQTNKQTYKKKHFDKDTTT